jgi:hypothetical protein
VPGTRAPDLEPEIDALFQRPLAEFTSARNALAARLRKEGRPGDAERVKALGKPPAPAWAVNQLFWASPKEFDRLFGVADRIRKAQTGLTRNADLSALLEEKKRMTSKLLARASAILAAAGNPATSDAMRRVSATLESLAVWGNAEGAPAAGRLTADLDPPGFDVLAAAMGGMKIPSAKVLPFRAPQPAGRAPAERARERDSAREREAREREAERARAIARQREAVKAAEKMLREARRVAERAEAAMAKADARIAAVEKQKQEIDARYAEAVEQSSAASNETKKAAQAVADAERSLARARAQLE